MLLQRIGRCRTFLDPCSVLLRAVVHPGQGLFDLPDTSPLCVAGSTDGIDDGGDALDAVNAELFEESL